MARQLLNVESSVNKQVEIDNLSEDTFVAKRLICDDVTAVAVASEHWYQQQATDAGSFIS